MRRFLLLTAAAGLALAPLSAQADPGKGKGHKDHAAAYAPGQVKGHPHGGPPGQLKKWSRGQRLPTTYITERYYVVEPARYRLAPAPVGYRWVMVEDNYYLAQTRTGLITQVVASLLR